jgi:lysophospholipase L1-like esterase
MTRAGRIALACAALTLGAVAALWQELPQWRIGGTRSMAASSVTHRPGPLACPADGTTIAVIGDSHVAGGRMGGAGAPFAVVLEHALGGRVAVVRRGVGGHTAAMGEATWATRGLPDADLAIIAYGTNDAAPRGWLRNKKPVGPVAYKASLLRQIAGWRARGAQIILLAPPPGGSPAIAARLAPYRKATRDVGRAAGVTVLDPAVGFGTCSGSEPVLAYDALHMNAGGHECLGQWLARQLCPAAN